MLNSKQLFRIVSLLRLFAWLLDMSFAEIDDLCQRCENEARARRQNEQAFEEPEWIKGAPWNDLE